VNIVHVCSAFYPSQGGVESHVYHVSRRVVERGHNVTVITSNLVDCRPQKLPKEEIIDGIRVRRFYVRSPYPISKLVFTPSVITGSSAIKGDVFHIFSFLPYFLTNYLSFYALRKGIPLVLTPIYHPDRQNAYKGMIPFITRNLYDRWIGLKLLRKADCIRAYGPADASFYREIGAKHVCIIGVGVEEVEYSAQAVEDFRARYGLTENTILSLSRIERRKGVQHVIEAMPLILKEYPNTKLLIAGGDMGYRGYLEKLIGENGIKQSVVFSGHLDPYQVACAFKASNMFLFPSYYEIPGHTLLEAWSNKTPVIVSSKLWGHAELITPETGIVIEEPSDYEAIAKAVVELLSNPERARTMGENGHRLVKERFSWDEVVDKLEEVYRRVVSNRIEGSI
jgi:glycosyltransferase involved in cell wall biosynthesis